jgi:hypothetical protein
MSETRKHLKDPSNHLPIRHEQVNVGSFEIRFFILVIPSEFQFGLWVVVTSDLPRIPKVSATVNIVSATGNKVSAAMSKNGTNYSQLRSQTCRHELGRMRSTN